MLAAADILSYVTFDLRLSRQFKLGEKASLQRWLDAAGLALLHWRAGFGLRKARGVPGRREFPQASSWC